MDSFTQRLCSASGNCNYLNTGVISQAQVLDLLKRLFELQFGYKPMDKSKEKAAAAADQRKPDKDAMRTKTPPPAEEEDPYDNDDWDLEDSPAKDDTKAKEKDMWFQDEDKKKGKEIDYLDEIPSINVENAKP